MWEDEVLEEIYKIREEHAKSFDYDLQAICDDLRKKQVTSGRQIISAPLKSRSQAHKQSLNPIRRTAIDDTQRTLLGLVRMDNPRQRWCSAR